MSQENHERYSSVKLGKCWQGKNPYLVWQVSPGSTLKERLPKKLYLIIDSLQASRGIKFSLEKPKDIKIQGGASSILRKHMPSCFVDEILYDELGKNYCIPLKRSSQETYDLMYLSSDKPPELIFVSATNQSVFRLGQKGFFTKKKNNEILIDYKNQSKFKNILDLLIEEFLSKCNDIKIEEKEDLKKIAQIDEIPTAQKDLKKKLARKIKTIKKSLEKQSKSISSENEIIDLLADAKLLQSYTYLIKKNMTSLLIDPAMSGLDESRHIDIDPDISPGQNVDQLFLKIKKMKKSSEIGLERTKAIKSELDQALNDHSLLNAEPLPFVRINELSKKYFNMNISESNEPKKNIPKKIVNDLSHRQFIGSKGALFVLGKSPSENDLLTKKAKSNDYWAHVISSTGSHVIIPNKSIKNNGFCSVTKKEAAILAVHFSKLREDRAGEVYLTQKRNLRKQKGLAIGLWLVEKAETYFVRYSEEELQNILASKKIN